MMYVPAFHFDRKCFRPFDHRHPHRKVASLGAFTVICINSVLQITLQPNSELRAFLHSHYPVLKFEPQVNKDATAVGFELTTFQLVDRDPIH